MAAGLDEWVPETLRFIAEFKMAADMENIGYEAVPETFFGEKWPAESMKGFPKLYNLSPS